MGLLRGLITWAMLGLLIFVGFTVPVGGRTLFGHISNIWKSDEAQELVKGVKETSAPIVDRVKRGVKASMSEDTPAEKNPPANKPENSDKPSKPDKPSKSDKLSKSDKPSKSDKLSKSDKPSKSGKPSKSDKPSN